MFKLTMAPAQYQQYGMSLGELGFQIDDNTSEIVAIKDGEHFDYFHFDSMELNDNRKEAVHQAVRTIVADELKKFGIMPVFLHGSKVEVDKPETPHVTVLTTELGKLKSKRDVIVVVGEAGGGSSGQDAGIWAYRTLMREGGIYKGSAVGLASKLREHGKSNATTDDPTGENATPGVFILNPGSLLYSYIEKKPMTQTTWLGRDKRDSLADPYKINEKLNTVQSHETPHLHIQTTLGYILPRLVNDNARIHIVAVGENVKDTIEILDLLHEPHIDRFELLPRLESLALIEPNHDDNNIRSRRLRELLATHGAAWVDSDVAAGEQVALPESLQPEIMTLNVDKDNNIVEQEKDEEAEDGEWVKVDSPTKKENTKPTIVDAFDLSDDEDNLPSKDDDNQVTKSTPTIINDFELTSDDEDDFPAPNLPPVEVSCPTYSAGPHDGIVETIFPSVIDDVLSFFWTAKTPIPDIDWHDPGVIDPATRRTMRSIQQSYQQSARDIAAGRVAVPEGGWQVPFVMMMANMMSLGNMGDEFDDA